MSTLSTLEGPNESGRGSERFGKFLEALRAEGVDLSSGGPYTVLAPSDSAFEKHAAESGVPITVELLKYHVIPGSVPLSALTADQPTLQGGKLTAERRFRKNWLDNAVVGAANWPTDVTCSDGVIHTIDTLLVPGAHGTETEVPPAGGSAAKDEAAAKAACARAARVAATAVARVACRALTCRIQPLGLWREGVRTRRALNRGGGQACMRASCARGDGGCVCGVPRAHLSHTATQAAA